MTNEELEQGDDLAALVRRRVGVTLQGKYRIESVLGIGGMAAVYRGSHRNGHRVARVPVIDRGPYVGGREFDLTAATADRLRFRGYGAIQVAN